MSALLLISLGDQAWWAGDRRAAAASWGAALEASRDGALPVDRAAEAMARMRLLHIQGNYAPLWHGPALDRALAACPDAEGWCRIAAADWHLWMPAFAGADPAEVPGLLAGLEGTPLEGAASARLAVAAGDPLLLRGELDGMGEGVRAHGARADDPGTWVLGAGLTAAPGAGIGLSARFTHPDLLWARHLLQVQGGLDSRGGWGLSGALLLYREGLMPTLAAGGGRGLEDVYGAGAEASTVPMEAARARAGALAAGRIGQARAQVTLAGQYRLDRVGAGAPGAQIGDLEILPGSWQGGGLWARGSVARGGLRLEVSGEGGALVGTGGTAGTGGTGGAAPYLSGAAALVAGADLLGGRLLVRPGAEGSAGELPIRMPSAGGSRLLRGLPAGRYRAAALGSLQAEYRHALVGPLRAQAFVDGAWVGGPHATAGAGLALALPPQPYNTIRLEVGAGLGPDAGARGVVLAWGEAF